MQPQAVKSESIEKTPISTSSNSIDIRKEFAVYQLIRAYRKRGHLISNTNPIRPRKIVKPN